MVEFDTKELEDIEMMCEKLLTRKNVMTGRWVTRSTNDTSTCFNLERKMFRY